MPVNTLHPDPDFTLDATSLDTLRDAPPPSEPDRARRASIAALAALLLVAAAAAYFLWPRLWPPAAPKAQEVAAPPPAAAPAPAPPAAPAIEHPVEQIPGAAAVDSANLPPLPKLDDSDRVASDALATILNGDAFLRLLVPNAIIRHIVATVDNLPRKTLATRVLPVNTVPGAFATANGARGMTIAPANSARYGLYVKAAEAIDTARLVQFYVRLYPLFQQAYLDLGYPNGYFNDRLIAVIDHLLAAPEPQAPIYLAQPQVMFEYADPQLENLSAGQKILVRSGSDNEMRLKAKLRQIRKALWDKGGAVDR